MAAAMNTATDEVVATSMDTDSTFDQLLNDGHPHSTSIPAIPPPQADSVDSSSTAQPTGSPIPTTLNDPSPLIRRTPSEATLVEASTSPPPAKKRSSQKREIPTFSKSLDPFADRLQQDINHRNHTWHQHLYHTYSGSTTLGSTLLHKLEKKGLASDIATAELAKYADYELENFTFLQEIIPNLFLGRYLPVYWREG